MAKIYELSHQSISSELPLYTESVYQSQIVGYYESLSSVIETINLLKENFTTHVPEIQVLEYKVKVINTDVSYIYIEKVLYYSPNGDLRYELKDDNVWPITNELLEVGDIVIYYPNIGTINKTKLGIISQAPEVGGMRNYYEILLGLEKDSIIYTSEHIQKVNIPIHHSLITNREISADEIALNEEILYIKDMLEKRLEHFKAN